MLFSKMKNIIMRWIKGDEYHEMNMGAAGICLSFFFKCSLFLNALLTCSIFYLFIVSLLRFILYIIVALKFLWIHILYHSSQFFVLMSRKWHMAWTFTLHFFSVANWKIISILTNNIYLHVSVWKYIICFHLVIENIRFFFFIFLRTKLLSNILIFSRTEVKLN